MSLDFVSAVPVRTGCTLSQAICSDISIHCFRFQLKTLSIT